MRLLLTRAAADAARTREKLEAAGHQVIVSPVIDMVGTGATWPTGVVDALLASSAQAFLVPIEGLSPESRRLIRLFVVGNRTLEAARAVGFSGPSHTAPTASALTDLFATLARRPRRMVYLAGRIRKPELETALAGLDQSVAVVEIYDARAVGALGNDAIAALGQNAIEGVLHFSRRSADIFTTLSKDTGIDVRRPTHFCLSEDVATPLREAGCPAIQVACAPNEPELLALVDAYSGGS